MAKHSTNVPEGPDELVPDPQVWREFGISSMTGWRWTHDPTLKFPEPVKIRGRCFRSRRGIEEFKQRMLGDAVARRGDRSA
jgi:hypothetical protein